MTRRNVVGTRVKREKLMTFQMVSCPSAAGESGKIKVNQTQLANHMGHPVLKVLKIQGYLQDNIQGDTSGCSLGSVNIKNNRLAY